MQNPSGDNRIFADQSGPVNLYHGTTGTPKLATTSTGVDISGTAQATTVQLGDWTITEDGNGKLAFSHSGTVKATLDDTGTFAAANDIFTDETL